MESVVKILKNGSSTGTILSYLDPEQEPAMVPLYKAVVFIIDNNTKKVLSTHIIAPNPSLLEVTLQVKALLKLP